MRTTHTRPGRHVPEWLIAATIIGVLLGLLIPAVSKVRDAAARTTCSGQFCQLVLAFQNYAATHSPEGAERGTIAFPAGTVPNPLLPPERRLSWHVAVLPFMERDEIYKRADLSSAWDSPQNLAALGVPVRHFRCAKIDREDPRPISTYAGLTGVGADSPTLPPRHPRAGVFGYDVEHDHRAGMGPRAGALGEGRGGNAGVVRPGKPATRRTRPGARHAPRRRLDDARSRYPVRRRRVRGRVEADVYRPRLPRRSRRAGDGRGRRGGQRSRMTQLVEVKQRHTFLVTARRGRNSRRTSA
jgi:Protein of unknown function (DUF1559)